MRRNDSQSVLDRKIADGEALQEIEAYYLGPDVASRPLYINLVFSGEAIGVGLAPHGEGVIMTAPFSEVDMAEYGRIVKRKVSDTSRFASLLGGPLQSWSPVRSRSYGDELGVVLKLSAGEIFVLNIGDEMFLGSEMPDIE